jgi:predicted  nucleic acid-binding Zn-ribbon protein
MGVLFQLSRRQVYDRSLMALIDQFLKLSGIDDRRIALERKLQNAPRAAKEADLRAKEAKDAVLRFKEEAKKSTLELKRLEADAKGKQQEIEKTQIAQNQAKGNDEFKGLGKRIEGLRAEVAAIETKMMQEYERVESRGADQAALDAKEKEAQAQAAKLNKEAEALLTALKAEYVRVEGERKAALEAIDKAALETYRQALDRHGDRATAAVTNSVCQGCFTSIRPNQVSMLRSREQLITCFECGRILHLE